jgi:hypothetical protein
MSQSLTLVVETSDADLPSLLVAPDLHPGASRQMADGLTIRVNSTRVRRAWGEPFVLDLVVTVAAGTAAELLASWLYDKLKGRRARLTIETTVVTDMTPEGLRQAIKTHVRVID